jgi:hypothetical protein
MVRASRLMALILASLILVGMVGTDIAAAQMDTGESYLGERMINGMFNLWPAAAIVVFIGLIAGGVVGFYKLDRATAVLLLAASAFLAYHFYWLPGHRV